jgi:hypothetical protein
VGQQAFAIIHEAINGKAMAAIASPRRSPSLVTMRGLMETAKKPDQQQNRNWNPEQSQQKIPSHVWFPMLDLLNAER